MQKLQEMCRKGKLAISPTFLKKILFQNLKKAKIYISDPFAFSNDEIQRSFWKPSAINITPEIKKIKMKHF